MLISSLKMEAMYRNSSSYNLSNFSILISHLECYVAPSFPNPDTHITLLEQCVCGGDISME